MNLTFDFDDTAVPGARMKVVGVGGAGGNAVSRMIREGLSGVDFVAINTDEQALEYCAASTKIRIGTKTTQGLGAGADPNKGHKAIEEDKNTVYDAMSNSDLIFVTAGMGGGTGTGAAPVVAQIARDIGALTVGIVTKPFLFEGPKRMQRAEEGIAALKEYVDTLIVIPNQRLLTIVPMDTPLEKAFRFADEILFNATKGISDLITIPGLVNLDFADVRTVMSEMGDALMGCGMARGENRAKAAAEMAINSPLLEDVSIAGALGLLVNITGGPNMTLSEVNTASTIVSEAAGRNANIIFGAVIDKNIEDEIRITVIATGLNHNQQTKAAKTPNNTAWSQMHVVKDNGLLREIPAYRRQSEASGHAENETRAINLESARFDSTLPSRKSEPSYNDELKRLGMLREETGKSVFDKKTEDILINSTPTGGNGHGNGNGHHSKDDSFFNIPTFKRKNLL
jgi:cell division protein FtsZ